MNVIREIFRGLLALQNGTCDQVSVTKEDEGDDRVVSFFADKWGAQLRTHGTWGSCSTNHSWGSTDYLAEAKTALSVGFYVGFYVPDSMADLDRLIQEIKAESEIDDFQLEFTE